MSRDSFCAPVAVGDKRVSRGDVDILEDFVDRQAAQRWRGSEAASLEEDPGKP